MLGSEPQTDAAGEAASAGPSRIADRSLLQGDAADPIQKRAGYAGSNSSDDEDRPRWTSDTVLVAVYDYHHEDGSYAYSKMKGHRRDQEKAFQTGRRLAGNDLQIERMNSPREFYQHPGLEFYMRGKDGAPDLLYRLPDLKRAMAERPDDPIYITEGEKDADTLWALGLITTTNPDGAMKWRHHFNLHLAGRDIVVFADNDERGREHAAAVARSVSTVAKSVKVAELPGLPVNGDVTDWLQGDKTRDDLLKALEDTGVAPAPDLLDRDANGRPYPSIENARLALTMLGAAVRYDEFAARYIVVGLPGFGPVLDDAALTRMRLLVEERWHVKFTKERWGDIVTDHARNNAFHPVCEYLDGLVWDGKSRLDEWLTTYAGAENNEYSQAVGAICLIAAIRRVREPGCKFDEMLVFEGEQGGNKSSAIETLAVNEDWFADDLPLDSDSKILMERTTGRWLIELAELKGLKRGAVEHVKSMLSRRVDKARLAYGRLTTEQPRQCLFFGTTNDSRYLRDMTGNRRFWPIEVKRFDLALLRRDRDQLWAEAGAREAAGDSIRLPEHLWAAAGEQQEGREIGDPFHEVLSERLEGQAGKIRASDVWEALGLGDPGRRTQDDFVRLSAAMQKLGWRRPKSKLRFDGRPQHAWMKGDPGALVDAYSEVPRGVVLGIDAHAHSARPM